MMNELKCNNFFNDLVTYYKNDKEVKSGEHYLSDFKLTADQDCFMPIVNWIKCSNYFIYYLWR